MKIVFSEIDTEKARRVLLLLETNRIGEAIDCLRQLQESIYAAIPEKRRISQGITWVVEQAAFLLAQQAGTTDQLDNAAKKISAALLPGDRLMGVPIFLMAEYGVIYPRQSFEYFYQVASAPDWVVREFAQGAFRKVIQSNRDLVQSWLIGLTQERDARLRRFTAETLRPVAAGRWLQKDPAYSLKILSNLYREKDPYPRTSVGNNLSDLSRNNPELIFSIATDLAANGDKNSYWIAYRACRNLVKKDPLSVMDLLRVDEYHYKDRNFRR